MKALLSVVAVFVIIAIVTGCGGSSGPGAPLGEVTFVVAGQYPAPAAVTIPVGRAIPVDATLNVDWYSVESECHWQVTGNSVAVIAKNALPDTVIIAGVKEGNSIVSVTAKGVTRQLAVTVKGWVLGDSSGQLQLWGDIHPLDYTGHLARLDLKSGDTERLEARIYPFDSSDVPLWKTTDPKVASFGQDYGTQVIATAGKHGTAYLGASWRGTAIALKVVVTAK